MSWLLSNGKIIVSVHTEVILAATKVSLSYKDCLRAYGGYSDIEGRKVTDSVLSPCIRRLFSANERGVSLV